MGLGQRRRDPDRFFGIAPRLWPQKFAFTGTVSDQSPRFGTLRVSHGVIGIEPDRFIIVANSFAIILEITALKIIMPLEIGVVSFRVLGCWICGRLLIRPKKCRFQRRSNSRGDFLLDGENIL